MKPEFDEYCADIDISDTLLTQIRNMHYVTQNLLGEEIDAIFISDVMDQSGIRNYQSIFFFSKHRFAYFTLPNTAICNVVSWRGLYPIINTSFDNYDFKKAHKNSRLRMVIATETNIATRHNQTIAFPASGNNCDYLLKIYTEFILPHL